jgi:hypothetical protein
VLCGAIPVYSGDWSSVVVTIGPGATEWGCTSYDGSSRATEFLVQLREARVLLRDASVATGARSRSWAKDVLSSGYAIQSRAWRLFGKTGIILSIRAMEPSALSGKRSQPVKILLTKKQPRDMPNNPVFEVSHLIQLSGFILLTKMSSVAHM